MARYRWHLVLFLVFCCFSWHGNGYFVTHQDPVPTISDQLSGVPNVVADWLESPQIISLSTLMANIAEFWGNNKEAHESNYKLIMAQMLMEDDIQTYMPRYYGRGDYVFAHDPTDPWQWKYLAQFLVRYSDILLTPALSKATLFQELWSILADTSDKINNSPHTTSYLLTSLDLTSLKLLLYQDMVDNMTIEDRYKVEMDFAQRNMTLNATAVIAEIEDQVHNLLEYRQTKIECQLRLGKIMDSIKMTDHVSSEIRICNQKHVSDDLMLAEGTCNNCCQEFEAAILQKSISAVWMPVFYPLKKWKIWIKNKDAYTSVNVTDVNAHSPRFLADNYHGYVGDDTQPGERVLQVAATDLDQGNSSEISFSIIRGDDDHKFRIDPATGWIHVASPLDRKTSPHHNLRVQALDNGSPQRRGNVGVRLDVLDGSDNAPLYVRALLRKHVLRRGD